jgi:WD40 repeat protein
VESVNFDHSEVIVAGGAASGTIKLWDLEEAKGTASLIILAYFAVSDPNRMFYGISFSLIFNI